MHACYQTCFIKTRLQQSSILKMKGPACFPHLSSIYLKTKFTGMLIQISGLFSAKLH